MTGTTSYSYEENDMLVQVVQSTDGKWSTTGGTRSLARVLGSTNICPHAGSAAEVANMKFDEVIAHS